MGDEIGRLIYDGQEAGEDPLVTVQYSATVLPWLLAAAQILLQPELWAAGTDMDEVAPQIHDLIGRLMGGDVSTGSFGGCTPFVIPAVSLYFRAATNPTKFFATAGYFLSSGQYTDAVNTENAIVIWKGWFEPGDYVLSIVHDKGYNRGKIYVNCAVKSLVIPVTDCYKSTVELNVVTEGEFTITDARSLQFELHRLTKNPSSSGNYILINAVMIRRKNAEEE
jgi:hypothetical protein